MGVNSWAWGLKGSGFIDTIRVVQQSRVPSRVLFLEGCRIILGTSRGTLISRTTYTPTRADQHTPLTKTAA